MLGIGQVGAATVNDIGSGPSSSSFSTGNAAGWAMIWWAISIGIILLMFMNL